MGRNSHDGTCAVTCEHVFCNPDRYLIARNWVDGVGTAEDARHLMSGLALQFGLVLALVEVSLHFGLVVGRGYHLHIFAFRSKHHEGNTEHGIGASGEDGELERLAVSGQCLWVVVGHHLELCLGTFRTTDPVALGLLQGVGPVDGLQAVEQTLGISRDAEAPLAHEFLFDGITATFAHAIDNLVVGQHGAEHGTPVHHRLAQIGDAIVHQGLLLLHLGLGLPVFGSEVELNGAGSINALAAIGLKSSDKVGDGLSFLRIVVVIGFEHLRKGPLCPLVVARVAGAYLAAPVEAEADTVELLAVTSNVLIGGDGGVLASLDGILFGGQAIGIVAHRVKNVEATEALVA